MFGEMFVQNWLPLVSKHAVVALADSILYPIEPHIHLFGPFFWMVLFYTPSKVHFIKGESNWFHCFGVVKQ